MKHLWNRIWDIEQVCIGCGFVEGLAAAECSGEMYAEELRGIDNEISDLSNSIVQLEKRRGEVLDAMGEAK